MLIVIMQTQDPKIILSFNNKLLDKLLFNNHKIMVNISFIKFSYRRNRRKEFGVVVFTHTWIC